jgi:hypothetical protein
MSMIMYHHKRFIIILLVRKLSHIFSMAFNIGNDCSLALHVAPFYMRNPMPHHPVQIEVVMCLRHGAQDSLAP